MRLNHAWCTSAVHAAAVWELYTSSRVFDEGLSIGHMFFMIAYQVCAITHTASDSVEQVLQQ
jgi:hypothetical protein